MSVFDILTFLKGFLSGLNVPGIEERAVSWLEENGEKYPDLKERTDALASWLTATLVEASPELDPERMANTIKGIAADVVSGAAGVDPEAGFATG